jgi:chromosome segregation ATPase
LIENPDEITSSIGNAQDHLRTPIESVGGADDAALSAEDFAALQARLNDVSAELQEARDVAQKVPGLQQALLDKEAELVQIQVASTKESEDLSAQLKALNTTLDDARAVANEEAADVQQMAMAEIASLKARLQAKTADSSEMETIMKQKVADGLADLEAVRAESAARLKEINTLKAQEEKLEKVRTSSATHVEDLQTQMSRMNSELEAARHVVEVVPALQQRLVASTKEVDHLKARVEAMSSELISAKEMESALKQKVVDAEARLKQVTAQQESTHEDSWVVVAAN